MLAAGSASPRGLKYANIAKPSEGICTEHCHWVLQAGVRGCSTGTIVIHGTNHILSLRDLSITYTES